MHNTELPELTQEQLLAEAKKKKWNPIYRALAIGFLTGIIVYSVAHKNFGLGVFLPAFLLFLMLRGQKKSTAANKS